MKFGKSSKTSLNCLLRTVVFALVLLPICSLPQKPSEASLLLRYEEAERLYWDADRLRKIGTKESRRAAVEKYMAAAELYRETLSNKDEATSLVFAGRVLDDLGETKKALELFERSFTLARQAGHRPIEAVALNNIGAVYETFGERQKALGFYNQALPLFEKDSDMSGVARTLNNIGIVYSSVGEKRKALEFFERSLPLRRLVGDKRGEAVTLGNIGMAYNELGNKQKALDIIDQSLQLYKKEGDVSGEAQTLNNLGLVYAYLGEKRRALEFFDRSLPLRRLVGDKLGEAVTLNNIGKIYRDLGEKQKAIEFFAQSLPLTRDVGYANQEAITLNNIGTVYLDLGELTKSLEHFNQSLLISRHVGDKFGETLTLNNIGMALFARGEKHKALESFDLSLALSREIGNRWGEAGTLNNLGTVFHDSGDKQKAFEYYARSLPISRQIGDREGEGATLNNIMDVLAEQNVPGLAILYGKRSVNVFQELRSHVVGLNRETQKIYLTTVEYPYRRLADLLITHGRIAEAEQVLALLKEEEYFSYLRRDDAVAADLKARIALTPDERKVFEDYEKNADEITRTAAEFGVLDNKKNALPLGESLSTEDLKQWAALKTKYDAAMTVFNEFLDDLKVRFAKQGEQYKQVAAVESDTQGLLKKLREPRTVIISMIVGEDRLNLIVTTSNIQRAHTVDIKAIDVNKLVAEFREAVKDPRIDPRPLGKRLYDILFPAALQKDLANISADTIVWSLDGTLRYVPMAALWDGNKYFAERYNNAILTLASRDKLNASNTDGNNWKAFGVGVSKPFEKFSALPAVPRELCSVINDARKQSFCSTFGGKNGVLNGMILADDEFTLSSFQNNLGKTPVVHIASHFSLNPGNEIDSYLLLGGGANRRFSLDDLRKTRLDNIELLTLSACNTAMASGNNSSGVEVEGFGALAQKQGARSILATLWSVADESTSMFMSEFYRIKKANPSMGKAEAIRLTQKAMIGGKIKATGASTSCRADDFAQSGKPNDFKCDPNAPFSHPYFWSPFVLIGNWR